MRTSPLGIMRSWLRSSSSSSRSIRSVSVSVGS